MTTKKAFKLKPEFGGQTIPVGTRVTFIQGNSTKCLVHTPFHASPLKVRITSAFKAPSQRQLEKWSADGVCKSIGGERVEQDGWGAHGDPSWLLALGWI